MDHECIFCKIIAGSLPATKIFEDEQSLAFLDLVPINPGHVLIIPKRHAPHFSDLAEPEAQQLFKVASPILKAIENSDIKCEGASIFINNKPAAGQEVMHTHLHIVPRFNGDNHKSCFLRSPQSAATPESLKSVAESIIKQLQSSN